MPRERRKGALRESIGGVEENRGNYQEIKGIVGGDVLINICVRVTY